MRTKEDLYKEKKEILTVMNLVKWKIKNEHNEKLRDGKLTKSYSIGCKQKRLKELGSQYYDINLELSRINRIEHEEKTELFNERTKIKINFFKNAKEILTKELFDKILILSIDLE